MLEHWLAILMVIGVVYFGVNYNQWLKRTRGCSAFTFWRGLGGAIDLFLWLSMLNADNAAHGVILFFISSAVLLALFYRNYKDSKSILHGFLMTLWLLLVVGMVLWILGAFMNRSEKD